MQKYFDPKRKVGSQSETARVSERGNSLHYSGYQSFVLSETGSLSNMSAGLSKKCKLSKNIFQKMRENGCVSISDIGCSNGGIGFFTNTLGFTDINLYDHDSECVNIIEKGINFLGSNSMSVSRADIKEITGRTDVVTMFAIIHWLYSCTSSFGSLHDIVKHAHSLTDKHLMIEWVSPSDPAIRYFKHLDFNKGVHKEQYSKENFIKALHQYFPFVTNIGSVTPTREIWLASNYFLGTIPQFYRKIDAITSTIYIDPTETFVIKKLKPNYLEHGVFEREVCWLELLKCNENVPLLYNSDYRNKCIVMSYIGERVTDKNRPADFEEQLTRIAKNLAANNCRPKDIKIKREVMVKNGHLRVCDFGWCPTMDNDFTIGGRVPDIGKEMLKNFADEFRTLEEYL